MSRPTNLLGYIQQLSKLPFVAKLLKTQYINSGIAAFVSDKSGNAYEVVLRPAAYAQQDWRTLTKKNENWSNNMSTTNSDILKQSIADAKLLREVAHFSVKKALEREILKEAKSDKMKDLLRKEIRKQMREYGENANDEYEIDLDDDEEDYNDFEHDEEDWTNDLYGDKLDDKDGADMTHSLKKAIKDFDDENGDEVDIEDIIDELENLDDEDEETEETLEPVSQAGALKRTKAKKRDQILTDRQYQDWKKRYAKEEKENEMKKWREFNRYWAFEHKPWEGMRSVSTKTNILRLEQQEKKNKLINENIKKLEQQGGFIVQSAVRKILPSQQEKERLLKFAKLAGKKEVSIKNKPTRLHELSGQSKKMSVQDKIKQWDNDKELLSD
jgi:hypothetical protein